MVKYHTIPYGIHQYYKINTQQVDPGGKRNEAPETEKGDGRRNHHRLASVLTLAVAVTVVVVVVVTFIGSGSGSGSDGDIHEYNSNHSHDLTPK